MWRQYEHSHSLSVSAHWNFFNSDLILRQTYMYWIYCIHINHYIQNAFNLDKEEYCWSETVSENFFVQNQRNIVHVLDWIKRWVSCSNTKKENNGYAILRFVFDPCVFSHPAICQTRIGDTINQCHYFWFG